MGFQKRPVDQIVCLTNSKEDIKVRICGVIPNANISCITTFHFLDNVSAQVDSNSDSSVIKEFKPAPIRLFYEESISNDMEQAPRPIINPNSTSIFARDNYQTPYTASNLFDDEPPEIQDQLSKPKDRKPANLFADDDSDNGSYQSDSSKNKPTDPLTSIQSTVLNTDKTVPVRSSNRSNIAPESHINSQQSRIVSMTNTNLFAGDSTDDENSIFSPALSKSAEENKPLKNPTLAKTANLFADVDIDDENELFRQKKSDTKEPALIKNNAAQSNIAKITDLFAANNSDEDDKLFSANKKSSFATKASVVASKNLFADNSSDEENSIFKTTKKTEVKAEPKSNFKSDIKADVEAKNSDTQSQSPAAETVPNTKLKFEKKQEPKPKTTNLFGDSDEDDNQLFSAVAKGKSISGEKKVDAKRTSLFGDEDDDDDPLFGPKHVPKNRQDDRVSEKPSNSSLTTKKAALNTVIEAKTDATDVPSNNASERSQILHSSYLFSDDFESDEDLFIPKPKASDLKKTSETTKNNSTIESKVEIAQPLTTQPVVESSVSPTVESSVVPATTDVTDEAQSAITTATTANILSNDFLGNLLVEEPPDEDIFKSSEDGAKKELDTNSLNDKKTALFDDSPFDDSDVSDKNQIAKEIDDQQSKPFKNYSSLQLFNDEPPPDDDTSMKFDSDPVKRTTKRNLIGVFDDTDNTIGKDMVGNNESISNTYKYMLFADEPPPFDLDEQSTRNIVPKQISKEILPQKLPTPKSLTIKKRSTVKTDTSTDSESSVNVEQIATTVTAKRPLANRMPPAKKSPVFSDVEGLAKPLESLMKSRAKITKPRKPSTRTGRKNQYERYVLSTEDEEMSEGPPGNTIDKGPRAALEAQNVHASDNKANTTANRKVFNLTVNQKELQSKIVSELRKRTSTLFQDDDEINGKNSVSDGLTKCDAIDKRILENKSKNLSADDGGAQGDQVTNSKAPVEAAKFVASPSVESFPKEEKTVPKTDDKINIQNKKKVSSLFGDESSDEDFFEKHIAKTALTAKKPAGATKSSSIMQATQTVTTAKDNKSAKPVQPLQAMRKSSKLFDSSEDDDDDLFLTKQTGKYF